MEEVRVRSIRTFDTPGLKCAIDGLAGSVPGATQLDPYAEVQDFLADRTAWFVRNLDRTGFGTAASHYR